MEQPNLQDKVTLHSQVEIELTCQTGNERITITIVPDDQADFSGGYLSDSTPLAKAILGHNAGEILPYHAGDVQLIEILSISERKELKNADHAANRKEAARKALHQIERTNALIFASSFSGKWGDYDPDGIQNWENDTK
jgi:hypothetical protein